MYQELLAPIHNFLKCPTPESWIEKAKLPESLNLLLIDHCNCELKAAQTAMFMVRKYAVNKESGQTILDWAKPYEDFVYNKYRQSDLAEVRFPEKSVMQASTLTVRDELPHGQDLVDKMVRLIKEEFHHFEQVLEIMEARNIPYQNLSAGRYAKGLMSMVRTHEPAAIIDKLIVGAYIEARSCERFAALAPYLDKELEQFYVSLLRSEARHYQDYLFLADAIAQAINHKLDQNVNKASNNKVTHKKENVTERVRIIGEKEAQLIQQPDDDFRFHSGAPI